MMEEIGGMYIQLPVSDRRKALLVRQCLYSRRQACHLDDIAHEDTLKHEDLHLSVAS